MPMIVIHEDASSSLVDHPKNNSFIIWLNKRNNNVIPFSYKATFKICISSVTLDAGISTTDLIIAGLKITTIT